MVYEFKCDCGQTAEAECKMRLAHLLRYRCECGQDMHRVFTFNNGNTEYGKPIISQSLAISPDQAAEHRQKFPGVELTDGQFPTFHNYKDHDAYLEKSGFVKQKGKFTKKRTRYGIARTNIKISEPAESRNAKLQALSDACSWNQDDDTQGNTE